MFMSHWLEISHLVNKKLDMRYAFYEDFIFLFKAIIYSSDCHRTWYLLITDISLLSFSDPHFILFYIVS